MANLPKIRPKSKINVKTGVRSPLNGKFGNPRKQYQRPPYLEEEWMVMNEKGQIKPHWCRKWVFMIR